MGKKIVDEDMCLNIKINGNEAKNELFELEEKVRDLSSENEKLERSIQKYGNQIEQNDKKLEKYSGTLEKERENLEKQSKAYSSSHVNLSKLLGTYKQLDQSGKDSAYGKRLLEDVRKQEEAVRKSMASGEKSKRAVEELEKSMKKLRGENDKLIQKRNEDTASLIKNKSEVDTNRSRVEMLRKNLDVTTLTIEELNREITRMGVLFRNTNPNDPRWKEYQQTLVLLRGRHQELSAQAQSTRGILCRAADGVNKYWNMVVSTFASFIGVIMGVKTAINKYVEFTDVLADVQKTTNLAKDEVRELNEEVKKIDTRSSQEELMGLARIGGKLGIEGKENLLGFVRAADKINVALKEDLGGDTEEAIRQVGKIVDIFKVNEEFGIEKGMLKVGSVINELGMASTANEGYIVEFTKRVAGIAPMTKISVDAVMGLAATFDQFGQTSEVASTVYSQIMTQMFKKTGTYARIAGMEVKEFSGLLKTDANEAFIRVMEGLKGNSAEIENMIASMGDMGMEGKRAVSVIGVLADHTKTLRDQQALANKAFNEGTSLTSEFGVKNSTTAAELAKARKELNNMIIDLGEKLQPVLKISTNGMSIFVRMLMSLFDFFSKNGKTITVLIGMIGGYSAAMEASIVWDKLKVLWTGNIITAFKKLYATIVANPWALLATAIAGVVSYLVFFVEWTDKAKKAVSDCQKEIASEQMEAKRLFEAYRKTNEGTQERVDILKILQEKYGPYLQSLIDEKGNLVNVAEAQKVVNDEITRSVALRMKEQASSKITSKYMGDYVDALDSLREKLTKKVGKESAAYLTKEIKNAVEGGFGVDDGIAELLHRFGLTYVEFHNDIVDVNNPFVAMQESLANLDEKFEVFEGKHKTFLERLEAEEAVYWNSVEQGMVIEDYDGRKRQGNSPSGTEQEILALKEKYSKRLITQEEYENKLDTLELAHLEYRLKNEDMKDKQRVELRQKIEDKKVAIMEKAKKKEQYIENVIDSASPAELKEKKAYDERLRQAGLFGVERAKMTKEQLQAMEILEKQHNANLTKIEKDAKKKRTDDYMAELKIRIKNTEMGQAMEVAQLKAAQSVEVESFSGSLYQRNEMLKRHQLEQLSLSEGHATEMIAVLGDIFGTIANDELTLGNEVLTEEQKNELLKRFEELKAAASGFVASGKELEKRQVSDVDVLGMSGGKWEEFFDNLKKGTAGIQEIEFAVGTLGNAWSAYTKLRAAQTQKELKQYEQKTKKEKAELDKQLDSGQISQEQYNARVSQLDADLDAKKEKLEKEQRERERTQAIFSTTISTAVGIAKAWELGPILGPIMSALVAAMGVMQIATIQAAQYATGRYPVVGADDDRVYDAEYVGNDMRTGVYERPTLGLFSEKEPEMVVDGNTTRKLIFDYPQIYKSIISISRGQVPRYANGKYPTENSTVSSEVSVGGEGDPEIKQLLAKNMQMMDKLMQMKFQLPMYGDNGLIKAIRKAQNYEQNTKTGRE